MGLAHKSALLWAILIAGCSGSSSGDHSSVHPDDGGASAEGSTGGGDTGKDGSQTGDDAGSTTGDDSASTTGDDGAIHGGDDGSTAAQDSGLPLEDAGVTVRPSCAPAAEELPEPTGVTYDPNDTLQKIVVSGPASAYAIGPNGADSFQLEDQGVYSDGTVRLIESRAGEDPSDTVVWTSSDTSIATVSSGDSLTAGSIQGLRPGTVTITVTEGSVSASVCFTITPAVVALLTITDPDSDASGAGRAIAKPDDTIPFVCTATLTNGTKVVATQSVAWTSSSPSVAQIASTGSADALVAGTTTITATLPPSIARSKNFDGTGTLTLDVIGTGGGLAEGATCGGTAGACAPGLSCCSLGRLSTTEACMPSPCPPPTP